jgi:hypothetical protein
LLRSIARIEARRGIAPLLGRTLMTTKQAKAARLAPKDFVFVDELSVRGKRSKVRLWTLAEHRPSESDFEAVSTTPAAFDP